MDAVTEHWVRLHKIFLEDLTHLDPEHVMIVPFEHLMGAGLATHELGAERMQALFDRMAAFLGIDPVHLRFQLDSGDDVTVPPLTPASSEGAGQRRNLLEYHGDRVHVHVQWSDPTSWIKDLERVVRPESPRCTHVIAQYEPFLNTLGYSIKPGQLTSVTKPQIEHGTLLWDI
jgi:hypothetical protein